jgi:hypothetical protein
MTLQPPSVSRVIVAEKEVLLRPHSEPLQALGSPFLPIPVLDHLRSKRRDVAADVIDAARRASLLQCNITEQVRLELRDIRKVNFH